MGPRKHHRTGVDQVKKTTLSQDFIAQAATDIETVVKNGEHFRLFNEIDRAALLEFSDLLRAYLRRRLGEGEPT